MNQTALPILCLKKGEERRITQGHLWIFSNEIDKQKSSLKLFEPGEQAVLQAANGKILGLVYVNPNSLICARILSRRVDRYFDHSFFTHRLKVALSLRERLFSKPFYRLVYGESDFLPGIVIDRFDDSLVVQITTAGMEQLKDELLIALEKVLKPRCIIFRNDSSNREMENLPLYTEVPLGDAPETVELEENGTRFVTDLIHGQKTGWFYDHRSNRERLCRYVKGKRVLDLFSYVGGWGIQAATAGASEVTCVDASERAINLAQASAELNGVSTFETRVSDVFDYLKQLREERQKFDVVIADPPAFIKRKKDLKAGSQAYFRLNQMALQVCEKDAILLSASCSFHLAESQLHQTLGQVSRHLDRDLQILETGCQGPDHPVHPAIPETKYIKSFICRVLRR